MNNKLIIFGAGKISEVVSFYINSERLYDICAYVIEDEFIMDAEIDQSLKVLVELIELES